MIFKYLEALKIKIFYQLVEPVSTLIHIFEPEQHCKLRIFHNYIKQSIWANWFIKKFFTTILQFIFIYIYIYLIIIVLHFFCFEHNRYPFCLLPSFIVYFIKYILIKKSNFHVRISSAAFKRNGFRVELIVKVGYLYEQIKNFWEIWVTTLYKRMFFEKKN